MGVRTGGLQDTRTAATLTLGLTTLDTTRAGRLPVSGAANLSTSGYDDLARDGVVFGPASWMRPLLHVAAHRSLFLGLVPRPPARSVQDRDVPVRYRTHPLNGGAHHSPLID